MYSYLKDLHKDITKITVPEGFPDYNGECTLYHQAGFDAYTTGAAFIYMNEEYGDVLIQNKNKLYKMRSLYQCFDIDGLENYVIPKVNIIYDRAKYIV
jgi:hypothetical protein